MHIIMRLLTAFIALGVWVPLIVAEDDDLGVERANGLTVDMAQAILDAHNELRAKAQAINMIRMEWNPYIAHSAQKWANECKYDHSKREGTVAGYEYLGENLYASLISGKFFPTAGVKSWYSEEKNYDYFNNECASGKVCGNYTQLMWAKSESLGCGAKFCNKLEINLLVCQYGPGGNNERRKPYNRGPICSECPEKHSHCVKGLCYHSPEDNTEISRVFSGVFSGGSLIRASYVTPLLLSCVALAQIMHY